MWERNKQLRKPVDLVFANAVGKPLDRHNLLHRHLKATAKKLNLPDGIDFRSFRTMHESLMRRLGRLEIARDNMGHAGGTGSITLDVYSKSWWEERVDMTVSFAEVLRLRFPELLNLFRKTYAIEAARIRFIRVGVSVVAS